MRVYYFLFLFGLAFLSCSPDETVDDTGDLLDIPYEPVEYVIPQPPGFSEMAQPANNKATVAGVELGHFLFFDPILSDDESLSCSGCHFPEKGFTDGKKVSTGINGASGSRSSMSLINIGYASESLFWDGRINNLEAQALLPVEDPLEMAAQWPEIEERLRNHDLYPEMFRKAFGISNTSEIDRHLVAKAIAQYERSLVSANSKFDQYLATGDAGIFEDEELNGFLMFNDIEGSGLKDAQCFHCHGGFYLSANSFFNNGLDSLQNLTDLGLGAVTNNPADNGKFRATSLRNIAISGPYMHDGRFETLEQVINFYSDSVIISNNLDVNLFDKIELNDEEKESLLAFLNTFTDTTYLSDPHFLDPF